MKQTEEATEQDIPSAVQALLTSGDLADAMIQSSRDAMAALRKGTPTDPKVMIDMALVADATGKHHVARSARVAAFVLRHPAKSIS